MINENEFFGTVTPPDNIICKNCKYRIGKTNYSNNYHKAYCAKYEYPNRKPHGVLHNEMKCEYYDKKDNL